MLMEVDECKSCRKVFTFESSKCGQILLKQDKPDSMIIFLPKCPYCNSQNIVELPWLKYGTIDY